MRSGLALDSLWQKYRPNAKTPWNLRRVVHLHRRAGFSATWEELRRDLKDGPEASVERLLAGNASAHLRPDYTAVSNLLADSAVASGEIRRLQAWWFYRMLFGPDPLGERLTLLWHDHFATANSKVQEPGLMRRQNDTFRKHARGKFGELFLASVREPALLLYLDAQSNRKGHPNENLAREAMELFTIGVGHFSEGDVKEAARALTGWTVEEGEFTEEPACHDDGEKTILGQKGKWTAPDFWKLLLCQQATGERIATKLCGQFFGENTVPSDAIRSLAAGLNEHELDIGWAVGVILKSQLFFADENLGNRLMSPVQFVVGAARALEMFDPAPSTLSLADWSARIGQDLFEPPNVGGWPGGRSWINTRGTIARANYVSSLLSGPHVGRPATYDPTLLPKKYGFGTDVESLVGFHHRLLFGTEPTTEMLGKVSRTDRSKAVQAMLSSPEAQLG
jgi:uncharacterized protein (DUF1800 family)